MISRPRDVRVFISYSRADEHIARELADILTELRIKFFLDVTCIAPGDHWDVAIHNALKSCTHLVLLHTKTSFASKNVWDEWGWFLKREKAVIPLLFDNTELPFRLERVQYIDFTLDNLDGSLLRLISKLKDVHLPKQRHSSLFISDEDETRLAKPYSEDDDENDLPPMRQTTIH